MNQTRYSGTTPGPLMPTSKQLNSRQLDLACRSHSRSYLVTEVPTKRIKRKMISEMLYRFGKKKVVDVDIIHFGARTPVPPLNP